MKIYILKITVALFVLLAPFQVGWLSGVSPARAETNAAALRPDEAATVFDEMAHQKDIAFNYVLDGCFARTQLMVVRMEKKGITAGRVWSLPTSGGELQVKSSLVKGGLVKWKFHVAPVIIVNVNGKNQYRVIDPSLFKRPVTVAEWSAAQKNTGGKNGPIIRNSKIGEAPLLASGKRAQGTGYWLGSDPLEGKTPHAVKTMKKFKSLEQGGNLPLPSARAPGDLTQAAVPTAHLFTREPLSTGLLPSEDEWFGAAMPGQPWFEE